jgi:glycosyltransferase involved in cell wall biosynthesis
MEKVLLINNGYPSKLYPNYTTYIATIHKCLLEAGFNVDLIVISYNRPGILHKLRKYIIFSLRLLFINLKQYDIIYITHPPFSLPIFLRKIKKPSKYFLHWHGNDLSSDSVIMRKIRLFIKKKDKGLNHIIPSQYFRNLLISDYHLSENIIISPSGGVDINLFNPKYTNKEKDKFNIGFSSALTIQKGINYIIEIAKRRKEIEFLIKKEIEFSVIDYGIDSKYFMDIFSKENYPVKIWSKMDKEKMPTFYNSIDILLMPSRRKGESLGLVTLEAMACDVPVIAFNSFAFPEFIISGISGELVDNLSNIKDTINSFIKSIVLIANYRDNYHPRSIILEKYSQSYVVEQYRTMFKSK